MYFLIERNNGIAWIVAHGCKLIDLDGSFREEAYRLLSGMCVKVEIDGESMEFNSSLMHDKVDELSYLMNSGKGYFQFHGTTGYDPTLVIQKYSL